MTAKEIFELRKNKQVDKAYEAARQLFATDKSPYASSAMFWTAVDKLKQCTEEGNNNEAAIILKALERLFPNVPDHDGWVKSAFERCQRLITNAHNKKNGYNEIAEHSQTGIWGEEVAEDYLRQKGFIIMERNWHSGHRDIDIIARKDEYIVFIEVKTRRNTLFSSPEQAVDWRKRRNLRLSINHYIKYYKVTAPIRFDIVTVVGELGLPHPTITHFEDIDIMR